MKWDKVKVPLCHYSDAPEESNLWTAWQLFPLGDDKTFDFKDPGGDRELSWVPKQLPADFQTVETKCGWEGHTRGPSEKPWWSGPQDLWLSI